VNIFAGQACRIDYNQINNMETIKKIKQLRGAGLSYGAIGKMIGLSRSRIHQICEEMILKTPRMKKIDEIEKHGGKCFYCKEKQIEFLNFTKGKVICWNCQFIEKQKVEHINQLKKSNAKKSNRNI
jgi:hypothetical protein